MLFTLTRKSNHLRVFFCRHAPTAADYRQTVGRVGACPSGDSAAAGDAVRIHQAQPPRRLNLVAAGEGSRRRSCLSRDGPGRHRSAWGRAPIPPSVRVPVADTTRNPLGREAGCLQARTKGAAGGGAAIAGHLVSRRRPGGSAAGGHACLVTDPVGVGWHGGAPPSPPAAGCPWLAFLGTRRGGRLVVCRRERRGRRAEGGNRGGRGQRARRRRRRAATWSASWGVSQ